MPQQFNTSLSKEVHPPKRRAVNILKLFFKLVVTAVCLWYVSTKINWALTWQLLQQSNKWWLFAAAVLFILSKIVSSFRLNIFFKSIGVHLSETSNLKLYWLGMFYNLFLPGGIGGDAYKVIALNRNKKQSIKLLSAAILLDRISGVAGLAILAAIYFALISTQKSYSTSILAAIIPVLIVYYFFIRKIFPTFIPAFTNTLLLGLLVQALQVLCVYCIMFSILLTAQQSAYIFIFLLSSIVAILPFTIGGLGAREVVFLWGSTLFLLDKHQSIYISILFYLITLLVSLVGLRWVYKNPITKENL
jgi:uncharacterized membrane protein YbhN (UPF0104 family)